MSNIETLDIRTLSVQKSIGQFKDLCLLSLEIIYLHSFDGTNQNSFDEL